MFGSGLVQQSAKIFILSFISRLAPASSAPAGGWRLAWLSAISIGWLAATRRRHHQCGGIMLAAWPGVAGCIISYHHIFHSRNQPLASWRRQRIALRGWPAKAPSSAGL